MANDNTNDKKVAISGTPVMSVRELTKPYLTESASAGGDWGPIYTGVTDANHLCYKVDWNIPNDLTSEDNPRRAEYLVVLWYLNVMTYDKNGGHKLDQREMLLSVNANGTINKTHTFKLMYGHKTDFIVLDLSKYYPNIINFNDYPTLGYKGTVGYIVAKSLVCNVYSVNSLDWDWNHTKFKNRPAKYKTDVEYLTSFKGVSVTTVLNKPLNPTIDPLELNLSNGTLTTTVNKPALQTNYPNTRGVWWITKQDNFTKDYKTEKTVTTEHTFSGDNATISYDAHQAFALHVGQWIKFTVYARTVGPTGLRDLKSRSYVFGYPPSGTIKSAEPSATTTATSSSGGSSTTIPGSAKIYFNVRTNHNVSKNNIVDTVTLQRLPNTTANTGAKAMLENNWSDILSDDETCTGLVDSDVAGATPDPGNYTWYRLKTVHGPYIAYSSAYYAKFLYRSKPTASDDTVQILDVFPTTDAKHLIVYLIWPADDSTGNEIQWTTDNRQWTSTGRDSVPSWRGQWTESTNTVNALKAKYPGKIPNGYKVMSFYISDVEPGLSYYIRARRYLENDSGTTYGKWNYFRNSSGNLMKICCTKKPTAVKLNGPSYLVKGEALPLTWTADMDSTIKYWQIVLVKSTTVAGVKTDKEIVLAEGSTNVTYTTISADVLTKKIGNDATIYLGVRLHTGGTLSGLAKKTIKIVARPTLTLMTTLQQVNNGSPLSSESTLCLRAQPMKIQFKTNDQDATIIVKIMSKGITTELPTGPYSQDANEVIWSGSGKASAINAWCTMTLPNTIPFIDGGRYRVAVVAYNKTTGLSSPTQAIDFTCNWETKVEPPSSNTYIVSTVYKPNASGIIYARIDFKEPDTRPASDQFDIYRITPDGVSLYARGCTLTSGTGSVYDYWAPYCNSGYLTANKTDKNQISDPNKATARLAYRIVARSSNGDVKWIDVPYNIQIPYVRIDWRPNGKAYNDQSNTFITFPYNLVMSDSYEKDFELREHLDGSREGYWGPAVRRTRSITTDVIRLENADQIAKMREMAQYAGPMFVRMPDGCAFEADVQVRGIDNTYNKQVLGVSLEITQIDLTKDFGHPLKWAKTV